MKQIVFIMAIVWLTLSASAENWSVVSPNGQICVSLKLSDLGGTADYPNGQRLYYRVELGVEGSRSAVLNDSPMGLQLQGQDFLNGLAVESATPPKLIDESYGNAPWQAAPVSQPCATGYACLSQCQWPEN